MSREINELLQEIIQRYGIEICKSRQQLKGILYDMHDGDKKEIKILLLAIEEDIVSELLNKSADNVDEIVQKRLINKLIDELDLRDETATWCINTWINALGKTVIHKQPSQNNSTKTNDSNNYSNSKNMQNDSSDSSSKGATSNSTSINSNAAAINNSSNMTVNRNTPPNNNNINANNMPLGTNAKATYKGITILGTAVVAILILCLFTPGIRGTLTSNKQDTETKLSDTTSTQKKESTSSNTNSNSLTTQVTNNAQKPTPTFDISQINDVINHYTDNTNISVCVIDFKNKQKYSTTNASQKFIAAGFYLPIFLEITDIVKHGSVNMDTVIKPSNYVYFGGTGTLKKDNAVNGSYTLRDYINAMMDSMDNGATNTLIEQFGGLDAINRAIQSKGYHDTVFLRQFGDTVAAAQGKNNYTSTHDAGAMIEKLYNDANSNSLKSSANMYNITMPEGRTYNAQFGTIGSTLNEFAIISNGNTVYGIVVLTNNVGINAANAISDINNTVDKQFK